MAEKRGRFRVKSAEPSRWGLTKKGQLYFIRLNDWVVVKFHKFWDGVSMMVFTRDEAHAIKLRAEHIEALIAYLKGNMAKVKEILDHRFDLDYVEELEEGGDSYG